MSCPQGNLVASAFCLLQCVAVVTVNLAAFVDLINADGGQLCSQVLVKAYQYTSIYSNQ